MRPLDIEAEMRLSAELDALSSEVVAAVAQQQDSPEQWARRRERIAALRRRVREMREDHLGHPPLAQT